jgi:hypothetical protein
MKAALSRADVKAKNDKGYTALDYAQASPYVKDTDVVGILKGASR